jgi:hypothetical protein
MVAQKWRENYIKEEEELVEYDRYLKALREPFSGLKTMSKIEHETKTFGDIQGLNELDKQFISLMNRAANAVGNFAYFGLFTLLANEPNPTEGFWKKLAVFGCLVEVVLALFIMFARPAFFDVNKIRF